MKKGSITVLICLVFTIGAQAWGVTGHRVVAEIAQQHLSPKARKNFLQFTNGYDLSYWANWSDFMKSDTSFTWREKGPWHYINIPGNLPDDSALQIIQQLNVPSLYSQIPAMINTLKNAGFSIQEKQEALWWLIHLVGDLHQPMHIGRAEDLGGNRVQVTWFNKPTNLHAVWDEDLIDFQQYSYTEFAKQINRLPKAQVESWQKMAMDNWFLETYHLANMVYATTPAGSKLSYRYNFQYKNLLEQQLVKAGVRLAYLLNQLFG